MSIEAARAHLRALGLEDRIQEFEVSSATVQLAAEALNCEPGRIAKTLSFVGNDRVILILAAGDARIDNAKFKAFFGMKAKMPDAEQAEALIGHAVGGICPFGIREGVEVYLDESLRQYDPVYPAAGSSNSAVRLSCEELERASGAKQWIHVTKLPE